MGYDLPVRLIYALHGFLGEGSDWNAVKDPSQKWVTPNLFAPGSSLDQSFNELQNEPSEKIFVGYSFGGRIGLSILDKNPAAFEHYVFVSVNPGFAEGDSASREQRLKQDLKWAEKISVTNWSSFLQEWNAQKVFSGSAVEPARKVESFDLQKLKAALIERSLGKQPDYSDAIMKNQNKITWVVGSLDEKFVAIAEELKKKSVLKDYLKIESGHRIPFDSPKKLSEIINSIKL
jgi:2-succinyl-6-hydroxy-2,4-cyclohexadiene-1-carboxylate synthase